MAESINRRLRTSLIPAAIGLVFASIAHVSAQPQTPAAGQMRLQKIEFVGLKTVKPEEALAVSGLTPGQDIDIAAIDAASEKLMQSGLFKNLSYSVKGTNTAASVIFKVEESVRGVPVVLDNFVWFSDEELRDAVRRKVPTFDGTAPAGGKMAEAIRSALQELLRERKIEGVVEYMLSTDAAQKPEHLFTVKGAGLRVCEVQYPGASGIPERELIENSSGIFNNEYTRTFVVNYVEAALLPLYRERGRLRASYRPPQVKPVSNADCEKGVALSIPIEEGVIYTWERAVWEGALALTSEELDVALGMKRGEVASIKKIERGVFKLKETYGRKGHLAPVVQQVPDFNDTDRRVTFRFRVEEGPQYRMGELSLTGLPEAEANNLRGRWRLLAKEVYDSGYLREFLNTTWAEFRADMQREGRAIGALKPEATIKARREDQTVDVTIDFKPQEAKKPEW